MTGEPRIKRTLLQWFWLFKKKIKIKKRNKNKYLLYKNLNYLHTIIGIINSNDFIIISKYIVLFAFI